MSWAVYGLVDDGGTDALEFVWNSNKETNPHNYNDETEEQFEFACSVVAQAFESEVVVGPYSVSLIGHSDPNQENDRKSLSISFNPVSVEYANLVKADNEGEEE